MGSKFNVKINLKKKIKILHGLDLYFYLRKLIFFISLHQDHSDRLFIYVSLIVHLRVCVIFNTRMPKK